MDSMDFVLQLRVNAQTYREEVTESEVQMLDFYRMRRNAQVIAMKVAQTSAAYREAQVAHDIYCGIVEDLEACLKKAQTPASPGSNIGSP